MNNRAKIIPEEQLANLQRWDVPAVDSPAPSRGQNQRDAGLLTAERIERIEEQAREEGFEAGRQEGLAAARNEMEARAAMLDRLMTNLAAPLDQVDEEVEQELVALAMAVARQLVRREIKSDPGQIVAVVREAMAVLPSGARSVELRMHPEDAAVVREIMHVGDDELRWRIVEDPIVSRGGCKVNTETTQVDATLESRLNAAIAQVLGGERGDDGSRGDER